MDPSLLGLLAINGAQNPGAFSAAMGAAGISPATSPFNFYPTLAESIAPAAAGAAGAANGGGQTTVTPEGTPAAAAGGSAVNPAAVAKNLGAFAGVAKPTAPQPEMRAGVSGAQHAPTPTASGNANHQLQLMQLLLAGGGPQAVPSLGALIGR